MKNIKGIILGMVFVFGMSFTADAKVVIEYDQDCLQDAWDFGTWAGEGDSYNEWYYTDMYVEMFC